MEKLHQKRKRLPAYFADKERELQGLETKDFVKYLNLENKANTDSVKPTLTPRENERDYSPTLSRTIWSSNTKRR